MDKWSFIDHRHCKRFVDIKINQMLLFLELPDHKCMWTYIINLYSYLYNIFLSPLTRLLKDFKKEFPKCKQLNENDALFYFIFSADSGVKAARNPSWNIHLGFRWRFVSKLLSSEWIFRLYLPLAIKFGWTSTEN